MILNTSWDILKYLYPIHTYTSNAPRSPADKIGW